MLRITIELVPYGLESKARIIGSGIIANDGTGNEKTGNYSALFVTESPDNVVGANVIGFDRLSRNVWELLNEALNNAVLKGLNDDD